MLRSAGLSLLLVTLVPALLFAGPHLPAPPLPPPPPSVNVHVGGPEAPHYQGEHYDVKEKRDNGKHKGHYKPKKHKKHKK